MTDCDEKFADAMSKNLQHPTMHLTEDEEEGRGGGGGEGGKKKK